MIDPNSTEELEVQIGQLSKAEIVAFRNFTQVYQVQHPLPVRPTDHLGWEFWTSMVTSLAAVILAAFRTGQAFYLAAVAKGNIVLSSLEAISAVFAVEGSVVLFALQRARDKKKTDARSSFWGLAVAFVISVLAGLFQSINIVSTPSPSLISFLDTSLVIAMGLGATIIAWLGGDILGVYLVRYELLQRDVNEQHAKSVHAYRANMLREWKHSAEQGSVNARKSSRYQLRTPDDGSSAKPTVRERVRERSERTPITSAELFEFFDKVYTSDGVVAPVNDTARVLTRLHSSNGSDDGWENLKSRISTERKKWMNKRGVK